MSICLQNPEKLIDVKEQDVTGTTFLIEANRYIFASIEYLYSKQQEPTPIAVMEVLKDKHAKKVVEDFGGVEYLTVLKEQRVSENNIPIFCEKLKQAYTRQQLFVICDEYKDFLLSDKVEVLNPLEITGTLEQQLLELTSKVQQTKDVYKMGEETEEILELRAQNPNTVPGLEVGWDKFDYYTNGGQGGDLIMVCARAKTGKSTILTNWAKNLSVDMDLPVLYFDTEMNSRQQEDRLLSIISGIPHKEIVSGMYVMDTESGKAKEKIERLREAVRKLRESNYFHIYIPSFTIDKVNAIAKKYVKQHNISAMFFDYLKFPPAQMGTLKSVQEWQMLGFIASGLKDLAGTLNVPIYSACQENRSDPKGGKKDETNVGGSDRILQLADKLIFLTNKTDEEIMRGGEFNGNQTLYIAYQRNGESDCPPINIKFDRTRCTQHEI